MIRKKRTQKPKLTTDRIAEHRDLINRDTFQIEWDPKTDSHLCGCSMFPSLRAYGKTPESALKKMKLAIARQLSANERRGIRDPLPMYLQMGVY